MLDHLNADQLADFDGIILYNYRYDDRKKALGILRDYVDRGGGLLIETGSEVQDTAADGLGDPFPVAILEKGAVEGEWMFETPPHPINQNVDFRSFAPPRYNSDPWKISSPSSDRLVKPWAQAILKDRGLPVVVAGELGKGRVVWSGINLPYHTLAYQNAAEAGFFASIIKWVFAVDQSPPDNYEVSRPHPEQVIVSGYDFRGVVFKETAFDGWSARLEGERGRSLQVYRAGPDFMYVRVPVGLSGPMEVRLSFGGAQADWTTLSLSVITLLLVLDHLLFSGRLVRIRALRLLKFMTKGTIGRLF